MSLPGLLIEYLVTGATAFLWLWLLVKLHVLGINIPLDKLDLKSLALLAPLAYVLGMILDFVSIVITKAAEFLIVDPLLQRLQPAILSGPARRFPILKNWPALHERSSAPVSTAEVSLCCTELGHQYEMRSSRDRVARGAFVNCLIGTAALVAYFHIHPNPAVSPFWILVCGLGVSLMLFVMWYRFEFLTYWYLRNAGQAILNQRLLASTASPVAQGAISQSASSADP